MRQPAHIRKMYALARRMYRKAYRARETRFWGCWLQFHHARQELYITNVIGSFSFNIN